MNLRIKQVSKDQYIIQRKYWLGWFDYYLEGDTFSYYRANELLDMIIADRLWRKSKGNRIIKEVEV